MLGSILIFFFIVILTVGILKRTNTARLLSIWASILFMLWSLGISLTGSNPWHLWGADAIYYLVCPIMPIPIIIFLSRPRIKKMFVTDNQTVISLGRQALIVCAMLAVLLTIAHNYNHHLKNAADRYAKEVVDCYAAADTKCILNHYISNGNSDFLFFRLDGYKLKNGVFGNFGYQSKGNGLLPQLVQTLYSIENVDYEVDLKFSNITIVPSFYQKPIKLRLQKDRNGKWDMGLIEEDNLQGSFDINPPFTSFSMAEAEYLFDLLRKISDKEIVNIIVHEDKTSSRFYMAWNEAQIRHLLID